MTPVGRATAAMFHAIMDETFDRAMDWFKQHPEEQFAYWGKDDFLPASAESIAREQFCNMHPEIDDLDDHTTVYRFGDCIVLRTFCPHLKAGIKELWDEGPDYRMYQTKTTGYEIVPEGDNFKITVYKL